MKSVSTVLQKMCKKVNKSFLKGVAIIGGIFIIYLLASKYYSAQVEPLINNRRSKYRIKKMKEKRRKELDIAKRRKELDIAKKKKELGITKIKNELGEVSGLVADNSRRVMNNEETLGRLSSTITTNDELAGIVKELVPGIISTKK